MRHGRLKALAALAAFFLLAADATGADNGGRIRLGYIITDDDGNLGINHETYNLYEGPSVSLEEFRYLWENGLNLSANLKNITLNNRHLSASLYKPGFFGVSLLNHQYRRIYSFDGDRFTRRNTHAGQAYAYPFKYLKLYGGFSHTDRHGKSRFVFSPYGETAESETDYTHTSFSVGATGTYAGRSLDLEYRQYTFTEDRDAAAEREGRHIRINGFAPVPKYEWITLSGGYLYRQREHEGSEVDLTINTGWAATRLYLPKDVIVEYRFLASRADHTENPVEIDNFVNTASLSRIWPKYGGLRVGYEYRVSDDIYNRTRSNGFLLSGWYRYLDRLTVRARLALREKQVTRGATLVGDEDINRHQITASYRITDWGDVAVAWQGKSKMNDDIDTRADYNVFSVGTGLMRSEYGRLSLSYSYYVGNYENRGLSNPEEYEFSDHVLTGSVFPIEYRSVQVWAGATYYRTRRDSDIEKIGGHLGARYTLRQGYQLEAQYQVFNYDNFVAIDQYYTGNIVNVYLIRSFEL